MVQGPPDQPKVFARPMDQASVSDDFLTIATSENTTTRKRLLALFLSTFPDISESVATRVINCVSLVDQTDAIDNLRNIPKPICMFSQPADPMAKERDEIKAAMRCANRQDASDRNYPKIADIVNDLVTKKLNRDEFPYVPGYPRFIVRRRYIFSPRRALSGTCGIHLPALETKRQRAFHSDGHGQHCRLVLPQSRKRRVLACLLLFSVARRIPNYGTFTSSHSKVESQLCWCRLTS